MSSSKYRHARNRSHLFSLVFFCEVVGGGGGWGECVALTCSELYTHTHIYIYVRGIFVSCVLNLTINRLVICFTCYVDIITSTKGYKNHTLEPLTKKLNKQVYIHYKKQCSFHIFLIGTGTDPCFRYRDGQEWQQTSPQSPKRYSLSHTLY